MEGITLEAARTKLLDLVAQVPAREIEQIPLEKALGRVLGTELTAKTSIPPFRKAPYDGYAIVHSEGRSQFTIVATIGAGERYEGKVLEGEAVRIMTGAPVPDDCDTIIMQERCRLCSDDGIPLQQSQVRDVMDPFGYDILVNGVIQKGENIIPEGEECAAGDRLMEAGVVLDAGRLSVAAGLGHRELAVYKQPKVVVLTSGREVVPLTETLQGAQIYNSNLYMLQCLLQEQGVTSFKTHHVSDDPEKLDEEIETIRELAADAELIISTGGVSVGLFDSMPAIYEALGAEKLYDRLFMRPGAASYGGVIRRENGAFTFCLGLSGNPTAAYNTYHLLVFPVLRSLQGRRDILLPVVMLKLGSAIHKKNPFDRYVQGAITCESGEAVFMPNRVFTSSALLGLAHANGMAKLEQGQHSYEVGDLVAVSLLKAHE